MSVLNTSYKRVGSKWVVEYEANSKLSLLVVFASFLAGNPKEVDLGMELLGRENPITGRSYLHDVEIAVVVARLVDAIKTCSSDVEKAIKNLSGSSDSVSLFAGGLLDNAWKNLVFERRRIRKSW